MGVEGFMFGNLTGDREAFSSRCSLLDGLALDLDELNTLYYKPMHFEYQCNKEAPACFRTMVLSPGSSGLLIYHHILRHHSYLGIENLYGLIQSQYLDICRAILSSVP